MCFAFTSAAIVQKLIIGSSQAWSQIARAIWRGVYEGVQCLLFDVVPVAEGISHDVFTEDLILIFREVLQFPQTWPRLSVEWNYSCTTLLSALNIDFLWWFYIFNAILHAMIRVVISDILSAHLPHRQTNSNFKLHFEAVERNSSDFSHPFAVDCIHHPLQILLAWFLILILPILCFFISVGVRFIFHIFFLRWFIILLLRT